MIANEEIKILVKQVMEYGYSEKVAIDIINNKVDGYQITQEERDNLISEIINKNIKQSNLKKYY